MARGVWEAEGRTEMREVGAGVEEWNSCGGCGDEERKWGGGVWRSRCWSGEVCFWCGTSKAARATGFPRASCGALKLSHGAPTAAVEVRGAFFWGIREF